jgi:transcription antitermination factor NusG
MCPNFQSRLVSGFEVLAPCDYLQENKPVSKKAELHPSRVEGNMGRTDRNRDVVRADMQADCVTPNWYVLFVRSNQEKRVAQHLAARAVEHFLPVFESVHLWRDRKVKLASPLFPGYIFIRLPLIERSKALLVPNVVRLVGTKDAPSVVSEKEIEWIRRGMMHGNAQPYPCLKTGDTVVIRRGPMAGIEGILASTQNSSRVLIHVSSINRTFAIEVDSSGLELAAPNPALQHDCGRATA